ncbi:MAG: ABC transporter permease [Fidelibacterota bacterium]|nr:MAG: ABC transporter permease [Candidatus Neomarinimicrobiota bacterium]
MFWSYVKIAVRNVVRQKLYSAINILGLAIGVAACITILLYVKNELSYDRYHSKADRIYRVAISATIGGNDFNLALSAPPVAAALLDEFPEVEAVTRIGYVGGYPVIRYGDRVYSEELFTAADSTIFDVFDIPVIQGDPKTALTEPNGLVITETTAKRYFGDENPIGKMMTSDKVNERIVTAVIEDFPQNSHFHYDFLLSFVTYPFVESPNWLNNNLYTYIVLKEGASAEELEAKFPDMVRKYVGPQIEQALGVTWEQMGEEGSNYELFLQPLTDIHLRSHLEREIEVNGNITYVYIFSLIAAFILIIACINFMNLATARSMNRAREVGVRKTLGSDRGQLIRQFLVESIVLTFVAVFVAVVIVQLVLPWFNNVIGLRLAFDYGDLPWIVAGAILVGILAGSYPAFFLSAFNPAVVLRGTLKPSRKGSSLRAGLVIFQFTISIILFTGTMIVKRQLDYMQAKDLGYNPESLLVVEKTDDIGRDIEAFKQELRAHPNLIEVTNSTVIPGEPPSGESVFKMSTPTGDQMQILAMYFTDFNFQQTYGFKMAEGRFFSEEFSTDSVSAVINQAAAVAFGVEDPVGQDLVGFFGGPDNPEVRLPIIGVMEDIHFESLHAAIRPMVIIPFGSRIFGGQGPTFGRYTTLRIRPDDITTTLTAVEDIWMGFALDQAFEYVFFEDSFNTLYENESRTQSIASMFSILAIFIACLGLLGLASFTAERRTKEIGIRKVLGATVASIFTLISNDFLKLVAISALLSLPLSWLAMQNWLENFAYRISYSVFTFLMVSLIALMIAMLTIAWQVLKAAITNPVDALRYE